MTDRFRTENVFPEANNRDLINGIKSNQAEVYAIFEKLIKVYSKKLQYEDAEGDLNLFFFEILNKLDTNRFKYDDSNYLCRYIKTSLRHKYISLSKEYTKEQRLMEDFEDYKLNNQENSTDFRKKVEFKEILNGLSEKQKQVLYYRYFYLFSDDEISKIFCISRQAVCQFRKRGIKILKEQM